MPLFDKLFRDDPDRGSCDILLEAAQAVGRPECASRPGPRGDPDRIGGPIWGKLWVRRHPRRNSRRRRARPETRAARLTARRCGRARRYRCGVHRSWTAVQRNPVIVLSEQAKGQHERVMR